MHTFFHNTARGGRSFALAALGLAIAGALVAPQQAHASAFQLKEDSAQAMGRAYAGSATAGGDVSVVINNPAAMSDLDGTYVQADITAINFSAKFTGTATDALGRPISGGNGGDAGTTLPVPAFALSTKINDRINLGFALDVPFGFQTQYDSNWMGRYNAIKTSLRSYDTMFSGSFKINDQWSVGGSLIAERTNADLTNAINFNAVGLSVQQGIAAQTQAAIAQIQAAAAAGQIPPAQAAAMIQAAAAQAQTAAAGVAALTPVGGDGYGEVKGNNWAWGWQVGTYWKATAKDRLALDYRSRITHDIKGTANFTTTEGYDLLLSNPALAGSLPPFQHTTGTARLTNPAVAAFSYWHQEDKWGFGADLAWTQWSLMRELTLNYGNSQPTTVLPFNWRNTFYVSVGGEYYATDKLTIRGGLAADQAPMNAGNRDPRVPDGARHTVAVGLGYKASDRLEFDASYEHIFVAHAGMNGSVSATDDTLVGSFDDYGNLLSLSVQYKF
ncbi:outer membrane protein transport protein [Dyella sp. 2HG41-7]|uniref:OmpP1/FadL family transporter n=1 Tax=Dyella sp. 2HG41-7 TaxID=2883239 RepID=UPI001F420FB6|nr:outer membrane protein transport protein [Dyella sp. 2HG41-7]